MFILQIYLNFFFRSLAYTSINKLPAKGMYHIENLNVSGNKELLYMPAFEVTPYLKNIHAAYNYQCCAYINNVSFECVFFFVYYFLC